MNCALDSPNKLGKQAIGVLENPAHELVISVGTIWELSIQAGVKYGALEAEVITPQEISKL